jgi:hypothetical protein
MDPDGILKACTTKVRIKSAKSIATQIASKYSLKTDLFFPSLDKVTLFCFKKQIYIKNRFIRKLSRKNYLKYELITSLFGFQKNKKHPKKHRLISTTPQYHALSILNISI